MGEEKQRSRNRDKWIKKGHGRCSISHGPLGLGSCRLSGSKEASSVNGEGSCDESSSPAVKGCTTRLCKRSIGEQVTAAWQ